MAADSLLPQDPAFAERVRASFGQQGAMHTIGASIAEIAPGRAVIALPWQQALTQQHAFCNPGMVDRALDSASGPAASAPRPADTRVLTLESKISPLAPAK